MADNLGDFFDPEVTEFFRVLTSAIGFILFISYLLQSLDGSMVLIGQLMASYLQPNTTAYRDKGPETLVVKAAKTLWDTLKLDMAIPQADIIIVVGSYDVRLADYSCQLWKAGTVDWIMFSGGQQVPYKGKPSSIAKVYDDIAVNKWGVPTVSILLDVVSHSVPETISNSIAMLNRLELYPIKGILLITAPFLETFVYNSFHRQWSNSGQILTTIAVTSPPIEFEDYTTEQIGNMDSMIEELHYIFTKSVSTMEGNLPHFVREAYQLLSKAGFGIYLEILNEKAMQDRIIEEELEKINRPRPHNNEVSSRPKPRNTTKRKSALKCLEQCKKLCKIYKN